VCRNSLATWATGIEQSADCLNAKSRRSTWCRKD